MPRLHIIENASAGNEFAIICSVTINDIIPDKEIITDSPLGKIINIGDCAEHACQYLPVGELVRVERLGDRSCLVIANGKVLIAEKLFSWICTKLKATSFIKVHQNHLVNVGYIKCMSESRETLELKNRELLPVLPKKEAKILEWIQEETIAS
ncbi:MAG: LytTR family transcriptional regulator [Bacteroidales bacterium]|nr:LytTR family transcriptional regulator [Bacteroidales bacterium]MBN2750958.1 LytTR family transcriptional regulator [Bacteroidales bacterium]